jgi:CheY-like chemotaxis protein
MAKVLVVEDSLGLQKAIISKLTQEGFEVIPSVASQEAMQKLEENPDTDFIWLDHYLLGEETGLDFITHVKGNEKFKHIPVFLVSNTATAEKIKTYMHLGIDKYYMKSNISLKEIIEDVKNLLEGNPK